MGVTRMGKTTIFLADDDEGVRRTLRTFFEGLPGYRVVGEACDGMEAVEGCRASAPDVALLDIQMPLLDGVSVARQVLADRAAKCVIILTAFSDREHIERVQACGAAGYLTKPFEAEKILPTIELCIAQQGVLPAEQGVSAPEPALSEPGAHRPGQAPADGDQGDARGRGLPVHSGAQPSQGHVYGPGRQLFAGPAGGAA